MKQTHWFIIFVAVIFFLSCKSTSPSKKLPKARIIEQLLDSLYRAKVFNGAIVVAENDSILFSKGYGFANFNDSIPFTPNTLSDGGSLGKTFTAAALWKLQIQGKLSLQDLVQKYLPGYPYANTTIIDLITHNAGGLPAYDYFFIQIPATAILTNESMWSILAQNKPTLVDAGRTGFNYENCGYDLAGLIIEKATGKKYEEVLTELFFKPLNMEATHVRPALFSQWKTPRTIGYIWNHDSLSLNDIADREGFYGGSNLHFTAMDLYKWGASFYNNEINKDIISEGGQPAIVAGKTSGLNKLNWYYPKNKKASYYWGNVAGFYSHLYHDDEKKFTIAFMTNTTMPSQMRQPLAAALVEIMETGDYKKEHFALPDLLQLNNDASFLGSYKTGKGDSIRVFKEKELLHIQRNDELRYNMYIVDSITAYVPGIDAWISFSKENDKLTLYWKSVFLEETAQRKND